jgi:hypothetical protein
MSDPDQTNPPAAFQSKKGEKKPAGPSGRRAVRDALQATATVVESPRGPGRTQNRRGLVQYGAQQERKRDQLNKNKALRAKVKVRGRPEKIQAGDESK